MSARGDKRRARREARKLARSSKKSNKKRDKRQKKSDKRAFALSKKEARRSVRKDRIAMRGTRAEGRQDTKQTAYEQGIDPSKAMWSGIGEIGKSVVTTVGGIYGAKGGSNNDRYEYNSSPSNEAESEGFFGWLKGLFN